MPKKHEEVKREAWITFRDTFPSLHQTCILRARIYPLNRLQSKINQIYRTTPSFLSSLSFFPPISCDFFRLLFSFPFSNDKSKHWKSSSINKQTTNVYTTTFRLSALLPALPCSLKHETAGQRPRETKTCKTLPLLWRAVNSTGGAVPNIAFAYCWTFEFFVWYWVVRLVGGFLGRKKDGRVESGWIVAGREEGARAREMVISFGCVYLSLQLWLLSLLSWLLSLRVEIAVGFSLHLDREMRMGLWWAV